MKNKRNDKDPITILCYVAGVFVGFLILKLIGFY